MITVSGFPHNWQWMICHFESEWLSLGSSNSYFTHTKGMLNNPTKPQALNVINSCVTGQLDDMRLLCFLEDKYITPPVLFVWLHMWWLVVLVCRSNTRSSSGFSFINKLKWPTVEGKNRITVWELPPVGYHQDEFRNVCYGEIGDLGLCIHSWENRESGSASTGDSTCCTRKQISGQSARICKTQRFASRCKSVWELWRGVGWHLCGCSVYSSAHRPPCALGSESCREEEACAAGEASSTHYGGDGAHDICPWEAGPAVHGWHDVCASSPFCRNAPNPSQSTTFWHHSWGGCFYAFQNLCPFIPKLLNPLVIMN